MVCLAHHIEPFIGGGLAIAVQKPAHTVDEDLRSAARNAVEPGGDQAIDHFGDGELRQARKVNHFRRRQRVQFEVGVPPLDGAKQIFVPGQRQIGIVAAL